MRRTHRRPLFDALLAALLLGTALTAPVAAQDPDPDAPGLSPTERLAALVERIHLEQSRLTSFEASFTQRKESMLLVEPEVSEGRLSYQAPDKVRWEFNSPNDTVVIIREGEMLTWYRDLGRAELLQVGRHADRILQYMSAGNSLETLKKYFNVSVRFPESDAPYGVDLEPRFSRVAKRLTEMSMKLHRDLYVPIQLRYVEPDGDVTELELADVRVNIELSSDLFETALPEGVEVREISIGEEAP